MAITQADVSTLIELAVANQPNYVWNELRRIGYNTNPYQPAGSELEAGLFKLYATDKSAFYSVLQGLPFDSTKTNSSTSGSDLVNLATKYGYQGSTSKIDWGGVWSYIVGTIGGVDTSTTAPVVTTSTETNIAAIIGLIAVAGLAVVIVYFAFFKK